MGLFSGSTSKTKSRSESFDQSSAASLSSGISESSSDQRVAFEDIFARLFGGAEGAAAGLDPSLLTDTANQLFASGTGFIDSIRDNTGINFLEDRLNRPGEFVDEQVDLLREDIGRLFSEELNPAIASEAVGVGAKGGGREGVAQGRALEVAADQFRRGATALRAGDANARDAIAGSINESALSGAGVGLSGLSNLAAIADLGFGAGLSPFERLASILGPVNTLTSASSSSSDVASSISSSFGSSFATSKSKGKSIGIG